ncbi:hypothetical protein C8Q77DRAFT_563500 [Trametes polyzona]|nr:hypothetical protein C8Q77DRAFT_563500 [Trametes polyzona]
MRSLVHERASLGRYRNTFARILRLPRERSEDIQIVVRKTHVCSLWRYVALNAPQLSFYRLNVVDACDGRSGRVPLAVIYFTDGHDHMGRLVYAVSAHMARVRVMHYANRPAAGETSIPGDPERGPGRLLESLRRLCNRNMRFFLRPAVPNVLTTLDDVYGASDTLPSMQSLTALLRQCPTLKILLSWCGT